MLRCAKNTILRLHCSSMCEDKLIFRAGKNDCAKMCVFDREIEGE